MNSPREIDSFVSCISGYYRLMVKWNMDLCSQLPSPSLKFLTDLKIHGPIGGAYSYNKIDEKSSSIGSFVVRQCERFFDRFYIDIKTKENQQPETFKICYESEAASEQWELFDGSGGSEKFEDLISLARSIPTNGRYFRLPPTQHDKSPLLLLCQTTAKLLMKETSCVRSSNPLVFRACDDLLLYKFSQREWGDGTFTRMKAELNQPNGKKVEVTLKILKQSEMSKLPEFFKLADKWAKIDLSEIVRMHGITCHQPISFVLESIGHGPLDEFLREKKYRKSVKLLDLVEVSYTLAKALHYLVSKSLTISSEKRTKARITCSKRIKSFMAEYVVQRYK